MLAYYSGNNMKKINFKKGYAILFTLVIVSIITSISIGISNVVYKQLLLASVASDSQTAFYAADTGAECALYASEILGLATIVGSLNPYFNCGVDEAGQPYIVTVTIDPTNIYHLDTAATNLSCYKALVDKNSPTVTNIEIKGYNTCNSSDLRQVERGIRIEYNI